MDALQEMSYLFAPRPEPDRAMARLEIVTSGGTSAISAPDIVVEHIGGGVIVATYEDAGVTWRGTGSSTTAAVLALLAGRIGHEAEIAHKD